VVRAEASTPGYDQTVSLIRRVALLFVNPAVLDGMAPDTVGFRSGERHYPIEGPFDRRKRRTAPLDERSEIVIFMRERIKEIELNPEGRLRGYSAAGMPAAMVGI
jgi:hypothetical protein